MELPFEGAWLCRGVCVINGFVEEGFVGFLGEGGEGQVFEVLEVLVFLLLFQIVQVREFWEGR